MEKFLKIVGIVLLVAVLIILSPLLLTVAIFFTYIPEMLIAGSITFGGLAAFILLLVWLIRK